MDPEPDRSDSRTAPPSGAAVLPAGASLAPGFELPTARQVVGRGLQLALDGNRDVRNVSLYVGFLVLAVAGPAALLVVVDLPRLFEINFQLPRAVTPDEAATLLSLIGPLYAVGALALLGVITVSLDGLLMATAILAGRAAGRPLTMREALQRARQVFWRYGFAAFVVGILSTVISTLVDLAVGALGHAESFGGGLIGTLIATLGVAPFGYILTAIVIGDVDGAAALGRSITLALARPRLALVVAAFAFLASTIQVLGLGVALDLVDRIVTFLDPGFGQDVGLLVVIPAIAIALVAFGSLGLTVGAVTAAPQITAFLGLTHFAGGLDRARSQPAGVRPSPTEHDDRVLPAPSPWAQPSRTPGPTRWVTVPMLVLIGLEVLAVAVGLAHAGAG